MKLHDLIRRIRHGRSERLVLHQTRIVEPFSAKEVRTVKIDVQDGNELNEESNKKGTIMLADLLPKVESLVAEINDLKASLEAASAPVPAASDAIVEAVVAALVAQGYTVTLPAA